MKHRYFTFRKTRLILLRCGAAQPSPEKQKNPSAQALYGQEALQGNIQNGFFEAVKKRYSCKKFDGRAVEKDRLEAVLAAGRLAPTAKNL